MPSVIDLAQDPGFTLIVEVEDEGGAPLEGATILLIHHGWSAGFCGFPVARSDGAVTDAAGRMVIAGLAASLPYGERYVVSVTHPSFAESLVYRPETLPRAGNEARARVRMARGCVLAGVVRGLPEGAVAKLTAALDDREVPGCHGVVRAVESDREGRFALTGLVAGEHTLRVTAPGSVEAIERVRVPREEPLAIVLVPGRQVSGTVIDTNGEPAAEIEVTATWSGAWGLCTTTTDAAGRFAMGEVPADREVVIVATTAREIHGEALGWARLAPAAEAVTLAFDARERGTWTGVMVDAETGEPIAREVMINAQIAGTREICRGSGTAADGRFALRLPPGRYDIAFMGWTPEDADAHALLRDVEIAPREVREDLRIPVPRAFPIEVHVRDVETGEPVAGAAVTAEPPLLWGRIWLGNTDAAGVMPIPIAFETPCRVWADAPGYTRAALQITLTRGMPPVELRLARR
jgi:hypothetical protein